MHALHTTEAFVLGSIPQGESNRVFRLFTKEFGYLYAHGQGVRDVRNRNRFALTTGQHIRVTLVRGRETWRITGAQSLAPAAEARDMHTRARAAQVRKLFSLCASLAPRETRSDDLYRLLTAVRETLLHCDTQDVRDVETIGALRLLNLLGYVAAPANDAWPNELLGSVETRPELIVWAQSHRAEVLRVINGGIESANV